MIFVSFSFQSMLSALSNARETMFGFADNIGKFSHVCLHFYPSSFHLFSKNNEKGGMGIVILSNVGVLLKQGPILKLF